MKKRILSLIMTIVMCASVFVFLGSSADVNAAEGIAVPTFKLKKINDGTGVKLVINKTKGAEYYRVLITDTKNEYSEYMFKNGKEERFVTFIKQDGTKKRSYTFKGLPKGTYTFKIIACSLQGETESKEKSVKIKAGKKVETAKEKQYDFSNVKVGDIIKFGSYEQDADMNNGTEDIEWIVLSKDKKKIFVVSKYILDYLGYNTNFGEVTWEDSSIRKWLNEVFLKKAFTKSEQSKILTTKIKNQDNPQYGTKGGNVTKDKVFLLSAEEATNSKYGFSDDPEKYDINRRCSATPYVCSAGINVSDLALYVTQKEEDITTSEGKYSMDWHLRTLGDTGNYVAFTVATGNIFLMGNANYEEKGIRPAMYISLK